MAGSTSVPTPGGASARDLHIIFVTELELKEALSLLVHTIVFQRLVGEAVYPEEIESQFGLYYVRVPTKYVSDEVNQGIEQAYDVATKRAASNTTELMVSFYIQDKDTKKERHELERWKIPFQLVTHTTNRTNIVDSLKSNLQDIVRQAQERDGFKLLPNEAVTFRAYVRDAPIPKRDSSLWGWFRGLAAT